MGYVPRLELALKDDIFQLCIESDSKLVIDMVTNNCKMNETILYV